MIGQLDLLSALLMFGGGNSAAEDKPDHLQPEFMKEIVKKMRTQFDEETLLRWLPSKLPWLTDVLSGKMQNDWHTVRGGISLAYCEEREISGIRGGRLLALDGTIALYVFFLKKKYF